MTRSRLVLPALLALAACPAPRPQAPDPAATAADSVLADTDVAAETDIAADTDAALTAPPPPPVPSAPDGTPIPPCPDTDVPGMTCVEGGSFTRGLPGEHACDQYEIKWSRDNATPAAEVWVSSVYIDVTEVTYAAYQACVEAGDCQPRQPNYLDFRRDRLPMTGLSWFEARDYCRAQGKRLPTEAEFEHAARRDGLHPWGDAPADCSKAVIMDDSGRGCGTPKRGSHPEKGRPLKVASRPAYGGLHDMIGNAEEWVADWYLPYDACGEACTGVDPRGPCDGADDCATPETKLVKGGSWYWPASCATGANRRHHFPANRPYHHFGFRCAASLAQARALAGAGASTPTPPSEAHPPAPSGDPR